THARSGGVSVLDRGARRGWNVQKMNEIGHRLQLTKKTSTFVQKRDDKTPCRHAPGREHTDQARKRGRAIAQGPGTRPHRQLIAAGGRDLERVACPCEAGTERTMGCNYGRSTFEAKYVYG